MGRRSRAQFGVADFALVTIVALSTVLLALIDSGPDSPDMDRSAATSAVSVDGTAGRPIPAGFLGLSIEFPAVEAYAGEDPRAIDPVFARLVSNLTPGQRPLLRIGGDSTDSSWWPVSGLQPPPGVTYPLTTRWLEVTRALTERLGAGLILGINLEADSVQLAAAEGQALVGGLGGGTVEALEIGNEPVLYPDFAWYRTPDGRGVTGRPLGYTFDQFTSQFAQFGNALPHATIAGPALGPSSWRQDLSQFLAAEPQVGLVTLHAYPLQLCFTPRSSPRYPTIGNLLSPAASAGFADGLAPYVAIAHARGLPLRIDELNTVTCGGDAAVSDSFASALWALDALFELARVGIDGVNIHTFPGAGYELFRVSHPGGHWRASVSPEYYGLLMFAQAAPAGSQLLNVGGAAAGPLKVWATRAPDGTIRVALINKGLRARRVSLRSPVRRGEATLERLTAPSVSAERGVKLGGRSFGSSTETALLEGQTDTTSERPAGTRYLVRVPAGSAALLVIR